MELKTEILRDAWYKLTYKVFDSYLEFEAYKMGAKGVMAGVGECDTDEFEEEYTFKGTMKWDGCIDFETMINRHFCKIHHAEQDMLLFNRLYELQETLFDY